MAKNKLRFNVFLSSKTPIDNQMEIVHGTIKYDGTYYIFTGLTHQGELVGLTTFEETPTGALPVQSTREMDEAITNVVKSEFISVIRAV